MPGIKFLGGNRSECTTPFMYWSKGAFAAKLLASLGISLNEMCTCNTSTYRLMCSVVAFLSSLQLAVVANTFQPMFSMGFEISSVRFDNILNSKNTLLV